MTIFKCILQRKYNNGKTSVAAGDDGHVTVLCACVIA